MTILYSHRDRLYDATGGSLLRAFARLVVSQTCSALACLYQAIVTAKTRRMQRELLFYDIAQESRSADTCESGDPGRDAAKFPRQPLILGDKWDF